MNKLRIVSGTAAAIMLAICYSKALLSGGINAQSSAHFIGVVLLWQGFDLAKALAGKS